MEKFFRRIKYFYYGTSGRDRDDCGRTYGITLGGLVIGTICLPIFLPILILISLGDIVIYQEKRAL